MRAHRDFVRCFVFAHHGQHLLQRHFGAVVDGAIRLGQPQQARVDQAARVDDAIRRLQQSRAALSDKIWCARAAPTKCTMSVSFPALQQFFGLLGLAQRAALVGEKYRPYREGFRRAAVQMQLDGLQQACHYGFFQVGNG